MVKAQWNIKENVQRSCTNYYIFGSNGFLSIIKNNSVFFKLSDKKNIIYCSSCFSKFFKQQIFEILVKRILLINNYYLIINMSQVNENQYDIKHKDQLQQQLMDEPMYNVDKYFIMNETQTFIHTNFSNENSRKILVKLIYLVNQGIEFSEYEVEQLFFRITKLFQSNSSNLRVMVYKSLKVEIYVIKVAHAVKTCSCSNPKFDQGSYYLEIHSIYLERIIFLINRKICSKFIYYFNHEPKENLAFHALILFHEIKKLNFTQFIQIIIQLMNKPLQPLVQQQLIKFTQELFKILDIEQKKIIVGYLIPQMSNSDP
ncbi:hypothetical protein pb186bvf_000806 [Paramecium bursaria]